MSVKEFVTAYGDSAFQRREEVVRCRDCKRFSEYELEPNLGYCERYDKHEVRCDGFCAWGERRADA